jgi:hypothetical protein
MSIDKKDFFLDKMHVSDWKHKTKPIILFKEKLTNQLGLSVNRVLLNGKNRK